MPIPQLTRAQRIDDIIAQPHWDIIIIGGGITGAGVFKLACQLGLKTLLVEQKDFAWGSSSRSSKMVHGGLRYIAQGQIKLTQESVQQRQRLLAEAPHLVSQQSFAMGHYKGQFPWTWIFNSLLWVYDLFARNNDAVRTQHHYFSKHNFPYLVPSSNEKHSKGGTQFYDALTDDARLVLRQIQEGQQLGGHAINYCAVEHLLYKDEIRGELEQKPVDQKNHNQQVVGVAVNIEDYAQKDNAQKANIRLKAKLVVNATGAWAGELANQANLSNKKASEATGEGLSKNQSTSHSKNVPIKIRPLRGSHIIVPSWRLPVASVVVILHPKDKRPVQVYPWQNVTVIGTTDVEHGDKLSNEPCISNEEFDYLFAAVNFQFPQSKLTKDDVISTFAGVRPVIAGSGFVSSSQEKRDHSIYPQAGLITVAGGKLTTFRVIAEQVLQMAAKQLNFVFNVDNLTIFDKATCSQTKSSQAVRKKAKLSKSQYQHLAGCYGALTGDFLQQSPYYQLTPISYSRHLWAELVWAVKYEQVHHLDDLLLRRTRLGNVLPEGAMHLMSQIKTLCQTVLQWNDSKWQSEVQAYQQLWKNHYSLPIISTITAQTTLTTSLDDTAKSTSVIEN